MIFFSQSFNVFVLDCIIIIEFEVLFEIMLV